MPCLRSPGLAGQGWTTSRGRAAAVKPLAASPPPAPQGPADGDSPTSTVKPRRGGGRRQGTQGAVNLSLADLAYGAPPWEVRKEAALQDVGLTRFVPSLIMEEPSQVLANR
mmetsp:Transcript_35676/g.100987  ORF Transcript_35676/g.100987 Transcript_35676/m.100987 type:complete len:111 (+) Transcript_35676:293-625(+)